MKNRVLKALAAFGLSVCVLAGSSVVGMAEETPGKTECKEHTWKTTTEYKTECVETTFQHKLPDGTTETLTLCPKCGKVKNNTQLTKVNGVFSNFSNLTVHTGTLKNGEQVMTAAFYYPTVIERVICEKCGTVKSEEVTPRPCDGPASHCQHRGTRQYRFRLQPNADQCRRYRNTGQCLLQHRAEQGIFPSGCHHRGPAAADGSHHLIFPHNQRDRPPGGLVFVLSAFLWQGGCPAPGQCPRPAPRRS